MSDLIGSWLLQVLKFVLTPVTPWLKKSREQDKLVSQGAKNTSRLFFSFAGCYFSLCASFSPAFTLFLLVSKFA